MNVLLEWQHVISTLTVLTLMVAMSASAMQGILEMARLNA